MMQQPMDVSSLLRQMQMNMMMPSLVSPQQLRMVPNMMQEVTLQPAQSSPVPAMSQPQAMVTPIQSQSVSPHANGSIPDHGVSSNLVGQQMAPYAQDGGSGRGRQRERRRDSRSDSRSRSYRRYRRRSSRHHRHRDSRPSRPSRASESDGELNIGDINLNPTHYLTRDFAKRDNIPSSCLMIRKLPCSTECID